MATHNYSLEKQSEIKWGVDIKAIDFEQKRNADPHKFIPEAAQRHPWRRAPAYLFSAINQRELRFLLAEKCSIKAVHSR